MVSSRLLRDALRARLAEHFELALTAAGVMLAVALTVAHAGLGTRGLAVAFLVWLQGFLIWTVRRHSRLGRVRLVRKLRIMLQDRVNNQLTVLLGAAELRSGNHGPVEADDLDAALTAAREVSRELEGLSLESLRVWESRYARYLPLPLR